MLSKYIKANQRDWDEILPFMLMTYRSSKQESTKHTPNIMFLGLEIDLPVDLLYPSPPVESDDRSTNEYVAELKYRLKTNRNGTELPYGGRPEAKISV